MNLKDVANFYKEVADESIALVIILAAIYCVIIGIIVPDWFTIGFGMVLMFYFKKNNDNGDK